MCMITVCFSWLIHYHACACCWSVHISVLMWPIKQIISLSGLLFKACVPSWQHSNAAACLADCFWTLTSLWKVGNNLCYKSNNPLILAPLRKSVNSHSISLLRVKKCNTGFLPSVVTLIITYKDQMGNISYLSFTLYVATCSDFLSPCKGITGDICDIFTVIHHKMTTICHHKLREHALLWQQTLQSQCPLKFLFWTRVTVFHVHFST